MCSLLLFHNTSGYANKDGVRITVMSTRFGVNQSTVVSVWCFRRRVFIVELSLMFKTM